MCNLNVTHNGLLKVHTCGRISCTKQIRWKSETLKVRLRFMFHYHTLPKRHLTPQNSSTALRPLKARSSTATKSAPWQTKSHSPSPLVTMRESAAECCLVPQSE